MVLTLSSMDYWELISLGVDASLIALFYYLYKGKCKDADAVEHAKSYAAGSAELYSAVEQAPDKCLSYACVEGVTRCTGTPLHSQHSELHGVVQHQLYVEHKSKRVQGFWSDVHRVLQDMTHVAPFEIAANVEGITPRWVAGGGSPGGVEVRDVLSAEYLKESMAVTHDVYEPAKDNIMSRTVDRLFGELTKGYHQTERMLGLGVPILGIGRLTLAPGSSASSASGRRLCLEAPDGGQKYIVTAMTKKEVVKTLKTDARTLKIFLWLLGLIGAGITAHFLYVQIKRIVSDIQFRRRLTEVRRRHHSEDQTDTDLSAPADRPGDQHCVVCMSSRREVIALDCGHVSMCACCSQLLREPKLCPVCRAPIIRLLPVYIA